MRVIATAGPHFLPAPSLLLLLDLGIVGLAFLGHRRK